MELQIIYRIISDYGPTTAILAVGALLWRMNMTMRIDLTKLIHDSEMRLSNDIWDVSEGIARLADKSWSKKRLVDDWGAWVAACLAWVWSI